MIYKIIQNNRTLTVRNIPVLQAENSEGNDGAINDFNVRKSHDFKVRNLAIPKANDNAAISTEAERTGHHSRWK